MRSFCSAWWKEDEAAIGMGKPLKNPDYWMITPSFPPSIGGVERHVDAIHQTIQSCGLHGSVLVLGLPPVDEKTPLARYIAKPKGRVSKFSRAILKLLGKDPYVKKVIDILNPDDQSILHFHDYHTLHPFLDALQRNGMLGRVYLTFHGWEGRYPPERKVIRHRQACASAARRTIAVGDFIPAWYDTPVDTVLYGGISPEAFSTLPPLESLETDRLCYLGQFREDTGLPMLLSVLERLSSGKNSDIHLHAYGTGPLAEAMACQERVAIHPPVTDVSHVLAEYPVIVASGYLSILEALYCQRVVIAMYHNPGRESYLRMHPMAKCLFLCGNAEELMAAVEQCQSHWDGVVERFEPAWHWAQDQTWTKVAETYLRLWDITG